MDKTPQHKHSQPIKITIKSLVGQSLSIIVNPDDTTHDIKVKIQNAWDHEPCTQMLLFAGKKLKDDIFPMNENPPLKNGCTIHLVLTLQKVKQNKKKAAQFEACTAYNRGQIFVKTLTGKTITLDVKSDNTIRDIKHKIQAKEGCHPEMQRLIFNGKNLCLLATLQGAGIERESTIHMILTLGSGATPPDSLLHKVFVESFCWWYLHALLSIYKVDVNFTKIIWDYCPFIELNAKKVHTKCMATVGRSERVDGICQFCRGYRWEKPYMDIKQIEQNLTENLLSVGGGTGACFYGLFFELEFKIYRSHYNDTWTIKTDVDLINDENIGKYIEIVVPNKKHKIPLVFELYDIGKRMNTQFVTIEIVENSLKRKEIQELFKNGKLEVNVLIHEKELPVIYTGVLDSKGPIIGDVDLQHFIYKI